MNHCVKVYTVLHQSISISATSTSTTPTPTPTPTPVVPVKPNPENVSWIINALLSSVNYSPTRRSWENYKNMDTREGWRPSTIRGVLHNRRHCTAINIHTVYQSICPFHCDTVVVLYRNEIFSSPLATGIGTAAENLGRWSSRRIASITLSLDLWQRKLILYHKITN